MVFARSSALLLLSLSLLWFTVAVHGEVTKPVPLIKTRSLVAVQGVVYCKMNCKYAGRLSLNGAFPIANATVRLSCNNTKKTQTFEATTDKNGYFLLKAPETISSFGAHKCVAFQWLSKNVTCPNPTPLNNGSTHAALKPASTLGAGKYTLYTVGPFVFDPQCKA